MFQQTNKSLNSLQGLLNKYQRNKTERSQKYTSILLHANGSRFSKINQTTSQLTEKAEHTSNELAYSRWHLPVSFFKLIRFKTSEEIRNTMTDQSLSSYQKGADYRQINSKAQHVCCCILRGQLTLQREAKKLAQSLQRRATRSQHKQIGYIINRLSQNISVKDSTLLYMVNSFCLLNGDVLTLY